MASNNAGNEQGPDDGGTVAASDAPPDSPGGIVETIKTVVYAVLIALFVRTVAYEPFNIPSGSMIPTLRIGDYLFVNKLSYEFGDVQVDFKKCEVQRGGKLLSLSAREFRLLQYFSNQILRRIRRRCCFGEHDEIIAVGHPCPE